MSLRSEMNKLGLTFRRWLAAAGLKAGPKTRQGWLAGEDPSDWRPKFRRKRRSSR